MIKEFMEKMNLMLNILIIFDHQNNVMDRTFKIATWNANELAKYSREITIFIFN